MTTPYIGEIKMGGWNFAPAGWAECDGTPINIDQNQALYQLIGTTYGGSGSTFKLPDLRGRIPVHVGPGFTIGAQAGSETVTLTSDQVPGHAHAFMASMNNGTQSVPTANVPATIPAGKAYIAGAPTTALASGSIQQSAGGGQSHDNMQPYLCVMFIIALYGLYPSQS